MLTIVINKSKNEINTFDAPSPHEFPDSRYSSKYPFTLQFWHIWPYHLLFSIQKSISIAHQHIAHLFELAYYNLGHNYHNQN